MYLLRTESFKKQVFLLFNVVLLLAKISVASSLSQFPISLKDKCSSQQLYLSIMVK